MTVNIPDEVAHNLTPEQVRLEAAVALFADNRISLGRATEIAGITHLQMQRELHRRCIPLHYGIEEYEEDMRTIRAMPPP